MVNATVSNPGYIDGSGDSYALFLKKWSGEILTTFEETNVMKALQTHRTIQNGKSAQFPVVGTATTAYHTPGQSLLDGSYPNTIKHAERLIFVDKMLTSSVFIAKADELINHYDVRSVYATELGRAMAKKFDEQLLLLSVIGAYQQTPTPGTTQKGSIIKAAGSTAANILSGIRVAMQTLDEKDIPAEDRAIIVNPETFYKIIEQKDMIDRDVSPDNGSMAGGTLFRAWGGKIYVSNHIPASVNHANTDHLHVGGTASTNGNNYSINLALGGNNTGAGALDAAAGINAVVLQKSGLGTVSLMDLAMESEYQVERQGSLFVSKYAMGHGVLRPECCAVVQQADCTAAIDAD